MDKKKVAVGLITAVTLAGGTMAITFNDAQGNPKPVADLYAELQGFGINNPVICLRNNFDTAWMKLTTPTVVNGKILVNSTTTGLSFVPFEEYLAENFVGVFSSKTKYQPYIFDGDCPQ